jgi:Uma2 family endonuclease
MSTRERSRSERDPRRYTVDDYMALDDGRRYELIDGELLLTPAPTWFHQIVLARLFALLFNHVEKHRLGHVVFSPADVVLTRHDVVQPDIFFISRARLSIAKRYVEGPPDLAVEALSPSTRTRDLKRKKPLYAREGVPHYWILDPKAKDLAELVLESGDYRERSRMCEGIFRSAIFPDLEIDVPALFRPLDV